MKRGYFGIGIEGSKFESNIGILFRSAKLMGADFVFTIGKRYNRQCTDTLDSKGNMPLYHYKDVDDFLSHLPLDCTLVAVELTDDARELEDFTHPKSCVYVLGAEDNGVSDKILNECSHVVKLNTEISLNVSVTGSLVMYDRNFKNRK